MKVQTLLCTAALGGLTLMAPAVLSQETPKPGQPRPGQPPAGQQPPRDESPRPGQVHSSGQLQALNSLTGTWQISVKTFDAGGSTPTAAPSTGTSTRTWLFDNKIMQEDVRCSMMRTASGGSDDALGYTPPDRGVQDPKDPNAKDPSTPPSGRPGSTPTTPPRETTPPRGGEISGGSFQGHGMFGFDPQTSKFQHIWCDSTTSKLTMSTGNWDESARTFTFNVQGAGMSGGRSPSSTTPPSGRSGGIGGDDNDGGASTPGQSEPPRPGTGGSGMNGKPVDLSGLDKVVIRLQDDTKHVVEYYKGSTKLMEIAYSKSGAPGGRGGMGGSSN